MKIIIQRGQLNKKQDVEIEYELKDIKERPMALEVLIDTQEKMHPGLAFRYGCRNGLCGVCTVDINGKSKLACRTKLRNNDKISHMQGLPIIKDLVVKRDAINKQLQGRLPIVDVNPNKLGLDHNALSNLNRCIECYACLKGCPVHDKNNDSDHLVFGNPYSFLRIQRVIVDPSATSNDKLEAINLALDLGVLSYDEDSVPGCGVGINLKKDVIVPLKNICKDNKKVK
ncbi:MAG: 2Fe-2S iron-sulfur cluster binding domain-containing protein [Bermanella sp.]